MSTHGQWTMGRGVGPAIGSPVDENWWMVKRTEGMREVVRPLGALEAHRNSRAATTGARSWQNKYNQWEGSQHSITAPSTHFIVA
jgi:hypothetical protein